MPAFSRYHSGTQSIERAVTLLRELAARDSVGWTVRDLAQHCGLDRATVHRMLRALMAQRLVEQRMNDRRYVLGPLNFELGMSVPLHAQLHETAKATVNRLARSIRQVVVIASLRSGDECVCIARAGLSSYTSQASAIRVGHRAPLLALTGGVAILAALPPEAANAIVTRNRVQLAHMGLVHLTRTESLLRASARLGYVLSTGVVWRGIHSLAVAFGEPGQPRGALVVSAAAGDYSENAMRRLLPQVAAAGAHLTEHVP